MSDRPTVLLTDYEFETLDPERTVFEAADIDLIAKQLSAPEDIVKTARELDADALLVQYAQITDAVVDSIPGLSAIAIYGIGVDNIAVDSATERGIPVLNVPDYCVDEVAEHALGLLLSVWRRTAFFDPRVRAGEWDWNLGRPMSRLAGSTVGVYGFGKIARRFARACQGLRVELLGCDPYVDSETMADLDVEKVDFDALLDRCNAISIHAPLTDNTRWSFDAAAFEAMADDAVVINTARGAIVDEAALAIALDEGEIGGAGIDVLPTEPPEESPLFDCEDAVLTPHVAWYSETSIKELRRTIAEDLAGVLCGDTPRNLVNTDIQE